MIKSITLKRKNLKYDRILLPFINYNISYSNARSSTSAPTPQKSLNFPLNRLVLYSQLAKFRLSSLVVLTSGAGYLCYGSAIDPIIITAACVGTGLCAGSANTFNQIFEKDYDKLMKRTFARPLPSGKLKVPEAVIAGTTFGAVGVGMLYSFTNPVVAALGAGNILLYSGAYTYSKRKSEWNTWIGSLVGAVPPVMGWAAASGGSIYSLDPVMLGSLLFLWQFPHFFALSWMHREDYARGGFQMVAVNDPVGQRTASLIMRYSGYLSTLPIFSSAMGLTSSMFALEGTMINAYLLYLSYKFHRDHSNANARRIFLCSLWYLPVLLSAYVFHSKNWERNSRIESTSTEQQLENKVTTNVVSDAVLDIKDSFKGVCIHEIIANNMQNKANAKSLSSSDSPASQELQSSTLPLCPKIAIEKSSEDVLEVVNDLLSNEIEVNLVTNTSQAHTLQKQEKLGVQSSVTAAELSSSHNIK